MGEIRRSGFDRRISSISITDERRSGEDCRDLIRQHNILIGKLKKTPFFKTLSDEEFKGILNICSQKTFSKNKRLFYEGDVGDYMFILLEGVLQIMLRGKELNLVTPVDFIGEMGIFTGEPRSATVYAKTDCVLLKINRYELFSLFEAHKTLNSRFQLGMIKNLSEKLRKMNKIIIDMKND